MRRWVVLVAAVLLVLGSSGCAWLVRSDVASDGTQTNTGSFSSLARLSADGRFTTFESSATNLVSGDTNGAEDIFVRDNRNGATERVSVANDGSQANGGSFDPAISADGRFVAFDSLATNLVSGDTNNAADVFVRDRQAHTTIRVSVATGGAQGNDASDTPAISGDGAVVAFESAATNLVPGDTNGFVDIFVHNSATGTTTRVSVPQGGSGQANGDSAQPAIDPTGTWVAFASDASDLVAGDANGHRDVFLTQAGNPNNVFRFGGSDGDTIQPALSAPQGGFAIPLVAYTSFATDVVSGDTNGVADVFVTVVGGKTERVSVADDGSQATGASTTPSLSGDGLRVAFTSSASNLVANDTNNVPDVFVRDRDANFVLNRVFETTTRASETEAANGPGTQGNKVSQHGVLSQDGRYVAFESFATNLVDNDTNNAFDVFTRFAIPPTVDAISPNSGTRGTTLNVGVLGAHYLSNPNPTVDFGPGITVNTLSVLGPGDIKANITITNSAPTGAHTVVVLDAGTGPGPTAVGGGGCQNCFTVN